jgi:hypothetical protein
MWTRLVARLLASGKLTSISAATTKSMAKKVFPFTFIKSWAPQSLTVQIFAALCESFALFAVSVFMNRNGRVHSKTAALEAPSTAVDS